MENLIISIILNIVKNIDLDNYKKYGKIIGILLWNVLNSRRNTAIESVYKHINVRNYSKASKIAKTSFINTGISFFEYLLLRNIDYKFIKTKVFIDAKSKKNLEILSLSTRPAVIITGHLGAWELLLKVLKFYLPEKQAKVVVKFPKNNFLVQLIRELRTDNNIEIVGHRLVTHKILPFLKKGGLTAFLADHNCLRKEAIFLPFLGEVAAVNFGPALIALRSKALVWPTFLLRSKEGFNFFLEDPLDTKELSGSLKEKIQKVTTFYTQCIEKKVLAYPEQWYWIHRRWKTRP